MHGSRKEGAVKILPDEAWGKQFLADGGSSLMHKEEWETVPLDMLPLLHTFGECGLSGSTAV